MWRVSGVCLGAGEEAVCGAGAQEQDGLSALAEILSSSSVEDGDFSREWRDVFGEDESVDGGMSTLTCAQPEEEEEEASFFLPSQLLDQNLHTLQSAMSGTSQRLRTLTSVTRNKLPYLYYYTLLLLLLGNN